MSEEIHLIVVALAALVIVNAWLVYRDNEPPTIWYTLQVTFLGLLLISQVAFH